VIKLEGDLRAFIRPARKQRRALISPEPPQRDVAAKKQHAGTPGADPRGQSEMRTPARPDAGADDRRSVIEWGSLQNAERLLEIIFPGLRRWLTPSGYRSSVPG
jgi:hypothetical protein